MDLLLFLKKLVSSSENIGDVASIYGRMIGLPVAEPTLRQKINEHPDYQSLLSVSDTFADYGADTIVLRIEPSKLGQVMTPYVVQIKTDNGQRLFSIVREIDEKTAVYLHPVTGKWKTVDKSDFLNSFTGIVMLADVERSSVGSDHLALNRKANRKMFLHGLAIMFLPLLALVKSAYLFAINAPFATWWLLLFVLLTLMGIFISVLLIWYEIDKYNPLLQRVCSSGKATNCSAVLKSGASSIFGMSWTVVGMSYFTGQLFVLLIVSDLLSTPILFLAWLSIMAIPYVLFSLYYQWRVVQQWCPLCLAIQTVLALQVLTFLGGGWISSSSVAALSVSSIIVLLMSFGTPFIMTLWIVSLLKYKKDGRRFQMQLIRLKHDPQIFHALLERQKAVSADPDGLGITFGNPNAPHQIIKVCNPYCGPCAKAHPILKAILDSNPDVQLRIIFTTPEKEGDVIAGPVSHLMAIASFNNTSKTKQALDDWYLAPEKEYEAFAIKYPLNDELQKQGRQLAAMRKWNKKMDIQYTPTFFVNGYQLPENYSISDVGYFLRNK